MFGYEGLTNVLKVVETGDGGIEELADEVNSSKVQYAYCRIKDPNTDLPKYVLINWQGEGAPESMKFKCTNHIRDIQSLFKAIHITVNARTEDDLDIEDIRKKVAKSSGANYSFHQEAAKPEPAPTPVSSVYQKTYAKKDISVKKRDEFWAKTEEEERLRLQREKENVLVEKRRLEDERKAREAEETAKREKMISERMKVINKQKIAERRANSTDKEKEKELWALMQAESKQDEEERRNRSESLRKERAAEAASLASNRAQSNRALFEQKSRQTEFDTRLSSPPPVMKIRNSYSNSGDEDSTASISPRSPEPQKSFEEYEQEVTSPESEAISPEPVSPEPAPAISPQPVPAATAINLIRDNFPKRQESEEEEEEEEEEEPEEYDTMTIKRKASPARQQPTPIVQEEPESPVSPPDDKGVCVRALYDYQAADETEISFDPDDIITNVEMVDQGWWNGVSPNGDYGMFPANYVELI